jgi:hypothetical protein
MATDLAGLVMDPRDVAPPAEPGKTGSSVRRLIPLESDDFKNFWPSARAFSQ